MTSDYGIIPYPKFDEAQEQYLTRIQDAVALVCVPITLFDEKTEAVGAALEALAAESYRNVTAVYFEVAMKVKYSRDDISSQMLDIVRGGAYLNFASIYNESIGNPWFVMRTLMGAKKKDFRFMVRDKTSLLYRRNWRRSRKVSVRYLKKRAV